VGLEHCEVLIVGGGPAGSACGWSLHRQGVDVLILDSAGFPRDKVCAGWITPPVIEALELDIDDYGRGRTFQPITSFRTGMTGRAAVTVTHYDRPVSFGIRRCEFDDYLLQRSGARLRLGTAARQIRRVEDGWIVNDAIHARVLIGAGGHFCPVARWLNTPAADAPIVAAQEMEFEITPENSERYCCSPQQPELYFCPDFKGYGWCFRKGNFLNVGFGRLDARSLPRATAEFVAYLKVMGRLPADAAWRWKGHAYLIPDPPTRRVSASAVLLVGDAAGLANPRSGEGIRPAIESGLLAASTVIEAQGQYAAEWFAPYDDRLRTRFYPSTRISAIRQIVPPEWMSALGRQLLAWPWFVRRWILNQWFLQSASG